MTATTRLASTCLRLSHKQKRTTHHSHSLQTPHLHLRSGRSESENQEGSRTLITSVEGTQMDLAFEEASLPIQKASSVLNMGWESPVFTLWYSRSTLILSVYHILRTQLFLTQSGQIQPFPAENMASDLELMIFILAASHSAVNHPGAN